MRAMSAMASSSPRPRGAARTVDRLRPGLRMCAMEPNEALPPPVQMVQMLAGFQLSQALYVTAKLGVADALRDGPRAVDDLASAVTAEPGPLRRLLRTLASIGVVADTGD